MRANVVAGAVLLVLSAAFWVQRDYNDRLAGSFPDLVLAVLALIGVALIADGILRGDRTRQPRELNRRMLAAAAVLVLLWALFINIVGFTISGVIAFVIMSLLVRGGRPTPRLVVIDVGVGIVVVVGCFLIFTRVLLVPLPVSTLIGM